MSQNVVLVDVIGTQIHGNIVDHVLRPQRWQILWRVTTVLTFGSVVPTRALEHRRRPVTKASKYGTLAPIGNPSVTSAEEQGPTTRTS